MSTEKKDDWRWQIRRWKETKHLDLKELARTWRDHAKLSGEPIKLNFLELRNLIVWFDKEARSRGIEDPDSIAVEDYIDPAVSYAENKKLIEDQVLRPLGVGPKEMTPENVDEQYRKFLEEMEADVKENMPEVYEVFETRLKTLKEEAERSQAEAVSAELKIQRYAERQRMLKEQLEETRKTLEESRSRPPAYQPISFRVIQPFREGIVEYRSGQVYSSTDLQWVIDKMKDKLIEAEVIRKLVKPLETPTPTATTPAPSTDKPMATELLAVWIKQELPGFIGSDMRKYGPFKPGDVAVLTRHDAEFFIESGAASTRVEEVPKPKEAKVEEAKFVLPAEKVEQLWIEFTYYLKVVYSHEQVKQFREEFEKAIKKAKTVEEATDLVQKLAERIKVKGEAPAATFRVAAPFAVPFQTTNKNAKIIKNDLLRGKKIYPMVFSGGRARFKTVGYLKVDVRNPTTGQYLGVEAIKVDSIANMPWKDSTERYELWKDLGVDWQCVEAPFNSMKLIRCIADNPMTGIFYEKFFLAPKGSEGTVAA